MHAKTEVQTNNSSLMNFIVVVGWRWSCFEIVFMQVIANEAKYGSEGDHNGMGIKISIREHDHWDEVRTAHR